ncbi:MAG: hypothetical protein DA408_17880 [Bacteroidetes bacterium]|nr:MAG: hypothetical protein DA408_17880 [Bacteroidota bacterium]
MIVVCDRLAPAPLGLFWNCATRSLCFTLVTRLHGPKLLISDFAHPHLCLLCKRSPEGAGPPAVAARDPLIVGGWLHLGARACHVFSVGGAAQQPATSSAWAARGAQESGEIVQ